MQAAGCARHAIECSDRDQPHVGARDPLRGRVRATHADARAQVSAVPGGQVFAVPAVLRDGVQLYAGRPV